MGHQRTGLISSLSRSRHRSDGTSGYTYRLAAPMQNGSWRSSSPGDDETHNALPYFDATHVWQIVRKHKLVAADTTPATGGARISTDISSADASGAQYVLFRAHRIAPRAGRYDGTYRHYSDYDKRLDLSAAGTTIRAPHHSARRATIVSELGRMRLRAGLHYAFRLIGPITIAPDYTLAVTQPPLPSTRFNAPEAAPFASHGIEATDRNAITLSLRYGIYLLHRSGSDATKRSHGAQPAAKVAWRLSERTCLTFLTPIRYRIRKLAPSRTCASDRLLDAATASIPPVRSHDLSGGYCGTLCGGGLRFSAEVYRRRMHNVLE